MFQFWGDAVHGFRIHGRGRPLLWNRKAGFRWIRLQRSCLQPLYETNPVVSSVLSRKRHHTSRHQTTLRIAGKVLGSCYICIFYYVHTRKVIFTLTWLFIFRQQGEFSPREAWWFWRGYPASPKQQARVGGRKRRLGAECQRWPDRDAALYVSGGDPAPTLRQASRHVVHRSRAAHPPVGFHALPRHEGPALRVGVRRKTLPERAQLSVVKGTLSHTNTALVPWSLVLGTLFDRCLTLPRSSWHPCWRSTQTTAWRSTRHWLTDGLQNETFMHQKYTCR